MIETSEICLDVNGCAIADFGKDAWGRLELELCGPSSAIVAIGECLKDSKLNSEPGGYRCYHQMSLELPPGKHCLKFKIPPHVAPNPKLNKCRVDGDEIAPFRYAQITGYHGKALFRRKAVFAEFDDDAAKFECSDPQLNQIWEFCKYSIKATTAFGIYIDGERERLPYEGDTYINQLGHFCCDANYTIAKKTIERLLEYPTWPTEWTLLMPIIVRDYVLYSGDTQFPSCCRSKLENCLLKKSWNPDGRLPSRPRGTENGSCDIVDWPYAERDHYEFGNVNFVPNAYLYESLRAMEWLYSSSDYGQSARRLKAALRGTMLRGHRFVDSDLSDHTSLHSAMFALAFGIAEPEEKETLGTIIRERNMACSVYGAQFLLEGCYRAGLAEHAKNLMTAEGLRSWRNMLEKGATITMEAWDDSFKPNQDWNHAWGAAPANIIPRFLCGVRPLTPGFQTYTIEPQPGTLKFFHLRHPTARGPLEIEYENGKLNILEAPKQ